MFGKSLEGDCKVSGLCPQGVWKVSVRGLKSFWKVPPSCFEGIQKASRNLLGKFL